MKIWIVFLAFAWTSSVWAQQISVSGDELVAGTADSKIQAIAKQAKAEGKKIVISAPGYWHEMVLSQVHRGGGNDVIIEINDSFVEHVSIRVAPVATQAEVAPAPAVVAAAPPAAVRPAETAPALRAPVAQPVQRPSQPVAASTPPPQTVAARVEPQLSVSTTTPTAPAQTQIAALPAPTTPAATESVASTAAVVEPSTNTLSQSEQSSQAAQIVAIKRRLQDSLNNGKVIDKTMRVDALEKNDVIYDQGIVKLVYRRDNVGNRFSWLEGDIDVQRTELFPMGNRRYTVQERIRASSVGNVRPQETESKSGQVFTAAAAEQFPAEKTRMEQIYNSGKAISGNVSPDELQLHDAIYTAQDLAVVARRDGGQLRRFWLVGKIDLDDRSLRKEGSNKYLVVN